MKKQEKKKIKPLRNIFDEYNNIVNEYKFNQSEEVQEKINLLQIESEKYLKERKYRTISNYLLLVLFLVNIFALLYSSLLKKEEQYLQKSLTETEKLVEALQSRDSLINQIEKDLKFFSEEMKSTVYLLNGLNNDLDKMKIDSVYIENAKMKAILNFIEKKYNITFKETDNYITIESPKLDSILLLVPYYRDKINYNHKIIIQPKQ